MFFVRFAFPLLAFWAVAQAPLAWALNPSLEISQHGHRAWRNLDGFGLGTITAIAQTADGYLWLATPNGLLRFDGVRSTPWPAPSGTPLAADSVQALLGSRDGSLWVGTVRGLIRVKDGAVEAPAPMGDTTVNALAEDADGTVWAGGSTGGKGVLCALRKQGSQCEGDDGRFGSEIVALHFDAANTLWVAGVDRVWQRGAEPEAGHALSSPVAALRTLTSMPDGKLIVGMRNRGIVTLSDGKLEPLALSPLAAKLVVTKILRDRDGGLWIGGADIGLLHLYDGKVSTYTSAQGLSGDHILDLFEDREGNVWASTSRGLDQFRPVAAASQWSANGLNGRSRSVMAASDGSLWAGTTTGIYQMDSSGRWERRWGAMGSLYEDRQGRVWSPSPVPQSGLGYFENGRYVAAPGVPPGPVDAMAEDASGNLWIAHRQAGLLRLRQRSDAPAEHVSGKYTGSSGRISMMSVDPDDNSLWLGLYGGSVEKLVDGHVRARYKLDEPHLFSRINQLRKDADGTVWVATSSGLVRMKGERLSRLDASSGLPCDRVFWSLADAQSIWLSMRCGLVQADKAELDAWAAAADRGVRTKVNFRLLDHWDGVPQGITYSAIGYLTDTYVFTPKMARTQDGRIWNVTGDSIVAVDPKRIPFNETPPPVHVEALVSDGARHEARNSLRLPPLQRNLEIEYTGLSLAVPEKVQFRYKLEGRDADWQDAGNRRQAFYTDLAPGHYRFHVTAANESGLWNREGDTLAFSIAPAWWQTSFFRVACVVAAALLLYGVYRWRIGQLSRRFSLSLEARVNERMRIARDLHDTLLQTFQGLVLRLQTAHQLLPHGEGRRILEEGIDLAADAITEGRDAVQGLRSASESSDLPEAIRALGQILVSDPNSPPARIGVEVHGRPRALHPVVQDDVFRIVGEALRNAFRHAHPTQVEIEIRYDDRELSVRVRDDGKGMERTVARRGRDGHFGLHGMRERAKLIGGNLSFWTLLGAGTAVDLCVPAARAYATDAINGVANHQAAKTADT